MSSSKMTRIQYPSATGPYKVCLKNSVPWHGASEARLHISVGKPAVEGGKLFAFCEWAAERFPHSVLVVSDTLQRFNVMRETLADECLAASMCRNSGDEWLRRNRVSISRLRNVEILRWDDALAKSDTGMALTRLVEHYDADTGFRNALDAWVERFCSRLESRGAVSAETAKIARDYSRAFLMEELAVFSWLCKPDGVDVYPGTSMQDVFAALHVHEDEFFDAFRRDRLLIDYERNKACSPLTFSVAA